MDACEQSKKRTKAALRCNGELGANFPLDLKSEQVENRVFQIRAGKTKGKGKENVVHPSKSLIEDYHSRNRKKERKKEERILEDSFLS